VSYIQAAQARELPGRHRLKLNGSGST